jgi:hypothetical protein
MAENIGQCCDVLCTPPAHRHDVIGVQHQVTMATNYELLTCSVHASASRMYQHWFVSMYRVYIVHIDNIAAWICEEQIVVQGVTEISGQASGTIPTYQSKEVKKGSFKHVSGNFFGNPILSAVCSSAFSKLCINVYSGM